MNTKLFLVAAVAATLIGCGGSDDGPTPYPDNPTAAPTAVPTATPTAVPTATPTPTPTPTPTVTAAPGDTSAVIAGELTATIANNVATATGTATITDPDTGEDVFNVLTDEAGTYGALSITDAGAWTYTLDTADATVAGLDGSADTITDTISISSADDTPADVVITITGVDPFVFAGFVGGDLAAVLAASEVQAINDAWEPDCTQFAGGDCNGFRAAAASSTDNASLKMGHEVKRGGIQSVATEVGQSYTITFTLRAKELVAGDEALNAYVLPSYPTSVTDVSAAIASSTILATADNIAAYETQTITFTATTELTTFFFIAGAACKDTSTEIFVQDLAMVETPAT